MTRFVVGLLMLGLAVPALAQEVEKDTPAKGEELTALEICKRADEATKAVKAVSYKAKFSTTGEAAARSPEVEGTTVIAGEKKGTQPTLCYLDAVVKMPNSEESKHYTVGMTPDMSYLIDHANKIAYADMDPGVIGSLGQGPRGLLMIEYCHPTPFNDEVTADKQELRESVKIGDQDCYVVYVEYSGGRGKAVWYFSKKDFLPRRVDRILQSATGANLGIMTTTLTDLKVDPKIDEDTFKLKLPEGYKKSDDFAP
ncbi:MAG: hypothetical protein C4547_16925 [Phycisphaerales bacterium]|nr:MAG: hypothetical protein C4547_16925 [Phycisphaerales bacterium]